MKRPLVVLFTLIFATSSFASKTIDCNPNTSTLIGSTYEVDNAIDRMIAAGRTKCKCIGSSNSEVLTPGRVNHGYNSSQYWIIYSISCE